MISRRNFAACRFFPTMPQALAAIEPDAVSINTWPDTHAAYAKLALKAGCHIFIEKPLADTVAEAEEIAKLAKASGKKLVIGYILRVHPSWVKFVEVGKNSRQAAGHAHESQPAIFRPPMGGA